MTKLRLILLVIIWPICAVPVQAQLFRKKAPPAPAPQRVPELVLTLKTDPEERNRSHAAEALREFDVQAYTEILPVLVEAARQDPKSGVRLEAISSLGKIRPVSREAGLALEQAASEDSNLRVRVHARTTLWKYQLAGYSARTPVSSPTGKTTDEPPLLEAPVLGAPTEIAPTASVKPTPAKEVSRPLPSGPAFTTAVPHRPRLITTRPSPEPTIVEDELPPMPPLPRSKSGPAIPPPALSSPLPPLPSPPPPTPAPLPEAPALPPLP